MNAPAAEPGLVPSAAPPFPAQRSAVQPPAVQPPAVQPPAVQPPAVKPPASAPPRSPPPRMRQAGWVSLTCRGWNWISCWCS